jgi:hypothetical protein
MDWASVDVLRSNWSKVDAESNVDDGNVASKPEKHIVLARSVGARRLTGIETTQWGYQWTWRGRVTVVYWEDIVVTLGPERVETDFNDLQ